MRSSHCRRWGSFSFQIFLRAFLWVQHFTRPILPSFAYLEINAFLLEPSPIISLLCLHVTWDLNDATLDEMGGGGKNYESRRGLARDEKAFQITKKIKANRELSTYFKSWQHLALYALLISVSLMWHSLQSTSVWPSVLQLVGLLLAILICLHQ